MADISLTQDLNLEETEDGVNDNSLPDLVTDEEALLPPFIRVQKYATSDNVYDRQMVSRILVELFRVGPADAVTSDIPKLMQLIAKLADEDEIMVRTDLLEQIPNLAGVAAECSQRIPSLSALTKQYLLPLVVKNLGSADNQIRKTAHSTLFNLLEQGLVTRMEAEIHVCPTVLAFTRMDRLLDYHTSAVTLMSKMAPLLGQEITERVFLDRFAELCSNETCHLRKVCASHFGDFCAVVSPKAYEKVLLPLFIELCKDENWGVRKACAEVVMSVSCACPSAARKNSLAPVFAQLLQDDNRWVRMSAFQTLGPFISTFADPTITSLGYNNMGEVVLVNADGAEFRINSPPFSDNNMKALKEFHKLFYQSDGDSLGGGNGGCSGGMMNPNMLQQNDQFGGMRSYRYSPFHQRDLEKDEAEECEEAMPAEEERENDEDSDDEDDEDIIMNPLTDDLDMMTVENEIVINGEAEPEAQPEILQNQLAATETEKYTNCDNNVVYNMIDGGGDRNKDVNSNVNSPNNGADEPSTTECINDLSHGIENISFEHSYSVVGFADDAIDDEDENVNVNNSINATNNSVPKRSHEDTTKGEDVRTHEDDLDKYNSHQYWYVRPDLPLDPEIISAGRSSPAKNNQQKSAENPASELLLSDVTNLVNSIWNDEDENSVALLSLNGQNSTVASTAAASSTAANDILAEPIFVSNRNQLSAKEKYDFQSTYSNCNFRTSFTSTPAEQPRPDTSQQHLVPQLLVDHFISMTDPSLAQNTDNDMAYHCAFSLPGVALTLGVQNWHLLKRTVEVLAYDMQYKVRRTVASSLHELALILGQDIATSCLAPIFEGFLKDLDEVRIGLLKHLAFFLELIEHKKRNSFLPRLGEFLRTDNEWNWRFREELAEQLLLAVPLFQPGDASKHISIVAQELLCDKVAAVRAVAIKLVTELIRHTLSSTESDLVTGLLIKLATQFAHSKRWKRRQVFALLCSDLMTNKALPGEQFATDVMPHLLDLSWDPVPNVRLVVAKTIARDIITNSYFSEPCGQKHYEDLQLVLRRLQTDKDRDVRQSALVEFYTNPIH